MKVIYVTKPSSTNTRRCLNCGKDISNKKSNAQFCCPACYQGYHGIDHNEYRKELYLYNT